MISSHWFALLAVSGGSVAAQTPYTSLGCFNDNSTMPALRRNEGRGLSSLDGTGLIRTDAINKCYQAAVTLGHNVFGLQNGDCVSIADVVPNGDYARYGTASICPADGRGASLINHVYQINGAANYVTPDYSTLPYTSLGCWRDSTTNRAMTPLEGDTSLDGSYFVRSDAINKCAAAAIARNLTVFGVQDGGQCWGALDNVPGGDYARQGNSSYCPRDGEGNVFVNHVYQIKNAPQASSVPTPYVSLGCWKDTAFGGSHWNRALRANEAPAWAIGAASNVGSAFSSILDGNPQLRSNAINKCYQVALQQGRNVFALQAGGQCYSGLDIVPGGSYAQFGNSSSCPTDGRGDININHVYQITNAPQASTDYTNLPYTSLGCWNDASFMGSHWRRLLRVNEAAAWAIGAASQYGTTFTSILDGNPALRTDAINKCYQVALQQSHNVFALQAGGQCYSGLDIVPAGTYAQYGNSSFCPTDGQGGSNINNVYQIKNASPASRDYTNLPYTSLGCWNDGLYAGLQLNRALRTNEAPAWAFGAASYYGTAFTSILDGNPVLRSDAINKCYQVALQQGHNVFALQAGGWCYSQLDIVPAGTYAQNGNSSFCPTDGKGSMSINNVYQIKNASPASRDYTNLPYTSLGCWNDQAFGGSQYNRALRSNEAPAWAYGSASNVGSAFSSILDGNPVLRSDAINKCYQVALQQGHNVFSLQYGGICYSQLDIVPGGSYARYGNSTYCPTDGKGGLNVNNVYQIKNAPQASLDYTNLPYTSLGCWNDLALGGSQFNRALRTNEASAWAYGSQTVVGTTFTSILDGNPALRSDAINKCYQVALQQGHNVFGVTAGGMCYSLLDFVPGGSYARYGNSTYCPTDGKGGSNVNNVYQIKNAPQASLDYTNLPYTSLGCWNDALYLFSQLNRALRTNEAPAWAYGSQSLVGTTFTSILDGNPALRTDAINKCYQVALQQGHNVFAVTGGGMCYSQLDVVPGGTYSQYGAAPACPADGKGAANVNHAYQIKNISSVLFDWPQLPYASLGCYKDGSPRSLRANEGSFTSILNGPAFNRTDAINKCYQVALQQGHNIFALQQNGQCFSSFDIIPGGDYARYGVSVFCPTDGRGASSVNHVYRVLSLPSKVLSFADLPYRSGLPFYSLGCWADSTSTVLTLKALTIQEGTDPILDGSYTARSNAIVKCYQVAAKRGHNVFALQNDGQCFSKFDTVPGGSYAQFGRSTLCSSNGKGAANVNNVYRIV